MLLKIFSKLKLRIFIKYFLAISCIFPIFFATAQSVETHIDSEYEIVLGGSDNMPFYLWANRMGQIPVNSGSVYLGTVSANSLWQSKYQRYGFESGFRTVRATGDVNYTRFIEAFGKFSSRHIIVGGGLYADTIQQRGLSVSNGNFFSGQNAEPHFRIKLATNGFIPVGTSNFSIAGLWEEGHTGKHNYVKNALLHHKFLLFRWGTTNSAEFTFGIDHYAYWSGKSPSQGYMPSRLSDYLRTILSLPGGKEATISDQENVQGNQLGQYYFIFRKAYPDYILEARIVHIFEDFSGMVFVNAADNLYSLSIDLTNPGIVDKFLLEFYHTKHQSGDDIDRETGEFRHRNGRDNYFNHSTYRSGYSHNGFIIGSPLFYPLNINNHGITTGVANNRFMALHAGAMGNLMDRSIEWKTMVTGSLNSGTYSRPFDTDRTQLSLLASAKYNFNNFPGWIGTSVAFDRGNLVSGNTETITGIMVTAGLKLH